VASIGNFDGVHLGHAEILRRVTAEARRRRAPSLLVSFDPHPLEVIAPGRRPRLIQTRRQKIEQLEACGLDRLLFVEFDRALAALEGRAFVTEVLAPAVPIAAIHVGEGFRFGSGRSGDLELLRQLGSEHGFTVHGVAPVEAGGEIVSSSSIRSAIAAGAVERAATMLGRPFAITGLVGRGAGRGATLGFRTANLEVENELWPAAGVYATEALAFATRWPSMTNVGVRPTFDGRTLTVETHLLDFDDHLYGERLELRFLARLRDEQRFAGATELAAQLARDRAATEAWFAERGLPAQ
jgi:riboflavin kinase/FMN adenylyltransferase